MLNHPDFLSTPHTFRLALLNDIGVALRRRYLAAGCFEDLEAALHRWKQAVIGTPGNSPDLPARLTNLGTGLSDRYAHMGHTEDLDQAVEVFRKAVDLTQQDSPTLAARLNNLGTGLSDRYNRTGNIKDLEEAVGAFKTAVTRTPENSPNLPSYLSNLGSGLSDLYTLTGDMVALEQALEAFKQAVARTPENSPDLPMYLSNLGTSLRDRYARTGNLTDLVGAVEACKQAVARTFECSPNLPARLSNLGNGLCDRYARTGDIADLDQALEAYRKAAALTPSDSPDSQSILNNLGAGLRDRYARTGDMADLDQALEAYRKAVDLMPEESPNLASRLSNFGNALRERYARTGEMADLEEALRAYRRSVVNTQEGSPDLAGHVNNLGTGLRALYARTENLIDLEKAVEAFKQAVARTPESSPALPMYLNNLGTSLRDRYARTGHKADLEGAISAYEGACERGMDGALEVALGAARNWGNWALQRKEWDEAIRATSYGLHASEALLEAQLLRRSKEAWLREVQGLHARAAYALGRGGALSRAVETLEQGRARLLGEVLERHRANLSRLRTLVPEVFNQYEEAINRLQVLEGQELSGRVRLPPGQTLTEAIREARAVLGSAAETVRQVPGYKTFLQTPDFVSIQAAVEPGCLLAYLIVTPAGTLILIVPSRKTPASPNASGALVHMAIWNDDFTESDLDELLVFRDDEDNSVTGGYLPAQFGGGSMDSALNKVLPVLGRHLMAPLADRLRQLGATAVVLIPSGWLGLLPLGAALIDYNRSASGPCFLDEFDVIYAPSGRARRAALDALESARSRQPLMVGVGDPQPSYPILYYSRAELEGITNLLPEGYSRPLYEREVTLAALLERLPGATYVHFACHGEFNARDPLSSALTLAGNDRFSLRDVLDPDFQGLADARLVVLSACQTAVTDYLNLPDEAVGFTAGFLQRGVPGVVGTLWRVNDLSTALLMTRFYEYHWKGDDEADIGPMEPPAALRQAQSWLRDLTKSELEIYLSRHSAIHTAWQRMQWAVPTTDPPFQRPYFWAPFTFNGA